MPDSKLRNIVSKRMWDYIVTYFPEELRQRLPDETVMRELLDCLSTFFLVERKRELIKFTNRVAGARKDNKPCEGEYVRDRVKESAFLDDLEELG